MFGGGLVEGQVGGEEGVDFGAFGEGFLEFGADRVEGAEAR